LVLENIIAVQNVAHVMAAIQNIVMAVATVRLRRITKILNMFNFFMDEKTFREIYKVNEADGMCIELHSLVYKDDIEIGSKDDAFYNVLMNTEELDAFIALLQSLRKQMKNNPMPDWMPYTHKQAFWR